VADFYRQSGRIFPCRWQDANGICRPRLDDAAVDVGRSRLAHIVGDVGVDVQRGGGRHVAQHGRERLHIHAVLQRERREGVAQVSRCQARTKFFGIKTAVKQIA